MRRLASPRLVLTALALAALAGCGAGTYQPSRSTSFEMDREAEIDDNDIRKAFEARPQMPRSSMRIGYYTLDPEIVADLDALFAALPGVSRVYRIPPLLVTGQRRLYENDPYYYAGPPRELSVKKLRLLAARADTDVLIIVDHGYRNIGVNALVGLSSLLLPILFVPFLDTTVKGYTEAFVMDVRNGYLYGHVVEEDERGSPYATIYAKSSAEYAKEQWADLRASLQKDLAKLVESERARAPGSTATPTSEAPAAVAAPPPPPPPPDAPR